MITLLEDYLNHPEFSQQDVMELRKFVKQPMLNVQIKALREKYRRFQNTGDIHALLAELKAMQQQYGANDEHQGYTPAFQTITRDDLRLICFDVLSS
jgi:hypothetical protein